ncbi:TPA: hypothetical protein ACH3X2_005009 [Trebouxia sp. C0005]
MNARLAKQVCQSRPSLKAILPNKGCWPLGNIMPVNAYRASKLLKPFMPQLRKTPVCVNDCCPLPAGYPADDETCCCNPSCNQPMFLNGKARKTFRTLSVQSVVKAAFASKDLAAELKKDPPVSSHASILRGWAGMVLA